VNIRNRELTANEGGFIMKKITFSHNTKRIAMFAGLAVVCVAVLSLVYPRVDAAQPASADSSSSSSEIMVEPPQSITVPPISSEADKTGTGSAFVPSSGATASKPLTVESKPSSKPPKPTLPASSALTNKAKKPSYSAPPKAASSTEKSSTSQVTSVPKGKSYMPGFGIVDGTGGGQGSTVGKPGDQLTGNKVGIMD
jgi:hypothetical protein